MILTTGDRKPEREQKVLDDAQHRPHVQHQERVLLPGGRPLDHLPARKIRNL